MLQALRNLGCQTELAGTSFVDLPHCRAIQFDYRVRNPVSEIELWQRQYYVSSGSGAFVITCTDLTERIEATRATFEQIARTFQPGAPSLLERLPSTTRRAARAGLRGGVIGGVVGGFVGIWMMWKRRQKRAEKKPAAAGGNLSVSAEPVELPKNSGGPAA